MDFMLHQQTALLIGQLKNSYATGQIDGLAYCFRRAEIIDHYMGVTDRQANPASTTSRLQRLNSFLPYLLPQEVSDEGQRMCHQFLHTPAAPIPYIPGMVGRSSFQHQFVQPQYPVGSLTAPLLPHLHGSIVGRGPVLQEFVQPQPAVQ
jgi:hypothetical protein